MPAGQPRSRSRMPTGAISQNDRPTSGLPLREEIRDALLAVIRDRAAPPSAVASACRTLADLFVDQEEAAARPAPIGGMSLEQIEAEIAAARARLGQSGRDPQQ